MDRTDSIPEVLSDRLLLHLLEDSLETRQLVVKRQ